MRTRSASHRWTRRQGRAHGVVGDLIVGGLALLALVLWAAIGGRRDEIGMAMVSGVTKGRLGWQFMLETFMMTVPGWQSD